MIKQHLLAAIVLFSIAFYVTAGASEGAQGMSPAEAKALLVDGNNRFVSGQTTHPRQDAARRSETVEKGQRPFVTVLGCSDSRLSPELIFDQGIGDVFVVRVAGNVANTDEIGSIEYGTEHLGTPLLVVLGHLKCGAVTAVVSKAEVKGSIPQLISSIKKAVSETRKLDWETEDEYLLTCIRANVWEAVKNTFQRSAIVRELVESGKLKVMGALYDPTSGKVEFLGEHPQQEKFLEAAKRGSRHGETKKNVEKH